MKAALMRIKRCEGGWYQGIGGIRAKLTKRGLVLRLGLVIWKAVGLRYAAGIYCREYSTSDRDIRGCSYD